MPKSRLLRFFLFFVVFIGIILLFAEALLTRMGTFLIAPGQPGKADAAVVLATGVDYYPRLMEAARLYRDAVVHTVVINGNRKSEALRELEAQGFTSACAWWENSVRILNILGVPQQAVITISAEDVYDTVSEAMTVGLALQQRHPDLQDLIITTSQFHTRRAGYIWRQTFPHGFKIQTAAAQADPFRADAWWRSGRQVRQLLAEYGAWGYYFWKTR
jgi:uncharacterized SAM-binding protein YcdF (DUF218 family)